MSASCVSWMMRWNLSGMMAGLISLASVAANCSVATTPSATFTCGISGAAFSLITMSKSKYSSDLAISGTYLNEAGMENFPPSFWLITWLLPVTFSPWNVLGAPFVSVPLYFNTGVTVTTAFLLKYFSGKVPSTVASMLPPFTSNGLGVTLNKSGANSPILLLHELNPSASTNEAAKNTCFFINEKCFVVCNCSMINFPKSAYKNKTFSEMLAYAPHLFYIFSFLSGLQTEYSFPASGYITMYGRKSLG